MERAETIYIFKNNIDAFMAWKREYSRILGIWWDGESSIIDGFTEWLKPKTIIVEEELHNLLRKELTNTSLQIIVQQHQPPTKASRLPSSLDLPICVFPSNDTHVYLFNPVINQMNNYKICTSKFIREGAREILIEQGTPFTYLQHRKKDASLYNTLVSANDWGPVEKFTHKEFQKLGVPTICLQESVIDFGDHLARMEWCNFPFIQGIVTARYLPSKILFLTGNPRYEALSPSSFPSNKHVLINSNFTYGLYEDIRINWIEDIVQTCAELGIDYLISQHPRDSGDLSSYNVTDSHAGVVHDMIRASSVLISRFSSLIHESIALGRPVIFFNPHGEIMNYDFEPDGVHIFVSKTREQLRNALNSIIHNGLEDPLHDPFYKTYGMRHYGATDGKASLRVVNALRTVQQASYQPEGRPITGLQLRMDLARLRFRLFRTGLGSSKVIKI